MNKNEFNLLSGAAELLACQGDESSLSIVRSAIIETATLQAIKKLRKRFGWDSRFFPMIESSIVTYGDHRRYSVIVIQNCHGSAHGVSESEAESIAHEAENISASVMLAMGIRFYCTREEIV